MTAEYQKFEIFFDADGVPITLFEIENWWANANLQQRQGLVSPDFGPDACKKIAQRIVQELRKKFSQQQLEIIKNFENQKQKIKNSWQAYRKDYSLGYDADIEKIKNLDYQFYNDDEPEPKTRNNKPRYSPLPPRPPDLPPIPKGDIFHEAMRKANEKLRREQEQQRARERYQEWQRQQAELNKPKPVEPKKTWRDILGIPAGVITIEQLNKTFRDLAKKNHPDVGGSEEKMKELIDARNQALKEIG